MLEAACRGDQLTLTHEIAAIATVGSRGLQ